MDSVTGEMKEVVVLVGQIYSQLSATRTTVDITS